MSGTIVGIKRLVGNWWFVLLVNTAFFVLMAWLLPIQYEESDDVTMCMIANGVVSGTPDGHLVYINALYGWILAGLYRWTKCLEWYTIAFCIFHVLAMTGVALVIIKDDKIQPYLKWLFLLFLYVIWIRVIMAFQFTTTAGLLCFSGCLAMLQSSKRWRMVGLIAVFIASLIRFSAAGLVGLLFVPMFLMEFIKEKRFAYWIVSVAFFVLAGHWVDSLFYMQPDWAEYRVYNEVRGFINDNPNAQLVENDLPDGVDVVDYQMLCSFDGDPNIMTLSVLQDIKQRIIEKMSLRQALPNLSQLSFYRIPLALLCVGVAACIVFCGKKGAKSPNIYVVCFSFLLFVIVVFYLAATALLKNRVFLCMLLPMTYIIVKSISIVNPNKEKVFGLLMLFLLFGLITKYTIQDYKVVRLIRTKTEGFVSFQLSLIENQKGIIFLGPCNIECIPVMQIKDIGFRMVGLGWLIHIPFQNGLLDSYLDLVDSDILYFSRVNDFPTQIMERIEKNYGIKARLEIVSQNEHYAINKFVSK